VFTASFDRPTSLLLRNKDRRKAQLLAFLGRLPRVRAGTVYAAPPAAGGSLRHRACGRRPRRCALSRGLEAGQTRRGARIAFRVRPGLGWWWPRSLGMGIDNPMCAVAHVDLPRVWRPYYQETGRAGPRTDCPAVAWMVHGQATCPTAPLHRRLRRRARPETPGATGKLDSADRLHRNGRFAGRQGAARPPSAKTLALPVATGTVPGKPRALDADRASQGKALSAVFRTGQRFGAPMLVDVLLAWPAPRSAPWVTQQ